MSDPKIPTIELEVTMPKLEPEHRYCVSVVVSDEEAERIAQLLKELEDEQSSESD